MTSGLTVAEVRARTYKARDSWWTVFLVDPLASRLVWLVARYPSVTPNRLTVVALLLGLGAAAAFAVGTPLWLVVGAAIFHLSFVVDCMDGKVARLNGTGSLFGAWLDYILDRVRVLICTIALMGGQYAATDNPVYLIAGGAVVFLDMFRYLNALQLSKVKSKMRSTLAARLDTSPALNDVFAPEYDDEMLEQVDPSVAAIIKRPEMAPEREFRSKFSAFTRFRDLLIRRRIRVHVISGIEFQMGVFIIGPLIGAVLVTTIVSGLLLLVFEFALIYKLWLLTKVFTRYQEQLEAEDPATAAQMFGPRQPADEYPVAGGPLADRDHARDSLAASTQD